MNTNVTISVLTYNSSKFVLETLESIKNQTYPHLFLQICDDCSTDNTVEVCKEWVERNESRFKNVKFILSEINKGISANMNSAWDNCETEWLKCIAGDDFLLPNCIEDNIRYVNEHKDAIFVFSKMKSFYARKQLCNFYDNYVYRYDFFAWSKEKQYDFIYNERSCIPTPTEFVNILKAREMGIRHDERIPMMEDVPKWLNALKSGCSFHYFDKITVMYRIHEGSLSTSKIQSPKSKESSNLFWFYYYFVDLYKNNPDKAIQDAVMRESEFYRSVYKEQTSLLYRMVKFIEKFPTLLLAKIKHYMQLKK